MNSEAKDDPWPFDIVSDFVKPNLPKVGCFPVALATEPDMI